MSRGFPAFLNRYIQRDLRFVVSMRFLNQKIIPLDLCYLKHKRNATNGASDNYMVPGVGLEPTSLAAADFKSAVYTNSTTRAGFCQVYGGTDRI